MTFRKQARYFFITYPRSTIEHNTYWLWIQHAFPNCKGCIICTEQHEDGTDHCHVGLDFGPRRYDWRNERAFDFMGRHPNIQTARNWNAVVNYVKKDGDYNEYGTLQAYTGGTQAETPYLEQAQNATDEAAFLERCARGGLAYGYAQRFWSIASDDHPETITDDTILEGTTVLPYLSMLQHDSNDRRATILYGPTGTGKTVWAREHSPRPALFVSQLDDLRGFRRGYHQSIIFDDMDFKHIPRTSQIHLLDFDNERSIHLRYKNVRIPAGIHKIFTCNELPFIEDPAIRRRMAVIDLYVF